MAGGALEAGKASKVSGVDWSGGGGQSGQDEIRGRQRSDLLRP